MFTILFISNKLFISVLAVRKTTEKSFDSLHIIIHVYEFNAQNSFWMQMHAINIFCVTKEHNMHAKASTVILP